MNEMKKIFDYIYLNNLFNCEESKSGRGSTKKYTAQLINYLDNLFKKYDIKYIFDAPCGDLNWIGDLLKNSNYYYMGGDISPYVIKDIHEKMFSGKIDFISGSSTNNIFEFNIVTDSFNAINVDVWLCRDCLNHLKNNHIVTTLNNFFYTGPRYALISNHPDFKTNGDLSEIGKYRFINFEEAPWKYIDLFHKECIIDKIPDTILGFPNRELILIDKHKSEKWKKLNMCI